MRIEEFSAKNVSDAIKDGLSKMGILEKRAKIEVLDQGGFLKKAKVRITDKGSEGERAAAFIEGLMEVMGATCSLELKETEEASNIEITAVNASSIIGHRGDVLDAIQYLASIVANEGNEEFKRIVVDCENYRAKRNGALEDLAKKMADKAVDMGRPMKLEPMNAFERRIIHAFLTNDDRVITSSYGEEPHRYLTIKPKNMKPRNDNFKRGGRNFDRKDGDRPYRGNRDGGNSFRGNRDDRGRSNGEGGDRPFRGREDRPRNDRSGFGGSDRPRKPSTEDSIKNGFSSFGFIGKGDLETPTTTKTTNNTDENKD